jgi:hypothetical protein
MPASANSQQVPGELHGKWNLHASANKLIGSIEIKPDGKYFYTALPNYRESGVLAVRAGRNGKEIDLVVKTKAQSDFTRGIYRVVNNQLQLCLGKRNGDRPVRFETNPKMNVILWIGGK